MQTLRQLGGGVIIAIISVILVIGGISLALAETSAPSAIQSTPTQIPQATPLSFFTLTVPPAVSLGATLTAAPSQTVAAPLTNTSLPPTSCTPPSGWIRVIASAGDTIYSLAQRYKTTPESLSAANCLVSADLPAGFPVYVPPVPTVTVVPCGAPAGWVKTHVVQPGDNLFRIALSYGITYPQLQRANCMGSSTTIYRGQRLWVPNIPTLTPVPGVTNIPNFPASTNTSVPIPATFTPSSTSFPTASSTSIPTNSPAPTSTTAPTASITPFPSSIPSP